LERAGGGLALTFIGNLVADLERALGDIADVFTFHGFCKRQTHVNSAEGTAGAHAQRASWVESFGSPPTEL
jgi:hypothetical protein